MNNHGNDAILLLLATLIVIGLVAWWFQPRGRCAVCGKTRPGRCLRDGWGGERYCYPNCETVELVHK